MKIPFVGPSASGRSSNVNAQRTVNFFVAVDKDDAKESISLIGTPGLKTFSALITEGAKTCIRAEHVMLGHLYVVCGNQVYSVDVGGTATLLGTISSSSGNVFMEDNGTQILIVDGVSGYSIIGGVLAGISDADFPLADSVCFQDGYFIVTEKDTGKIYISGLYDVATWDALDFASAESNPDYAVRVMSSSRELWVFGKETIEPFYNSGNADFPFERIQGAVIQCGTNAPASPVNIGGQYYWLSDTRRVVRNVGYQPQVISTPSLEHQIAKYATVGDARAYTCTIEGHAFYVLIFPTENKTWMFDCTTNYWTEMESYANKDVAVPWSRHRSNCCIRFNDQEIIGDYENGKLYELDMDTFTDNEQTIRRQRCPQYISKDRVNVIYHELEIEFEAGTGLSGGVQGEDPQACLDWSDDGGHTFGNEHWVSVGKIGEYKDRARWQRMGMARSRLYRLTVSDPVKWVILAAYAELEALAA